MTAQVPFTLRGRNPDVLTCIVNLTHYGLYDTVVAREQ